MYGYLEMHAIFYRISWILKCIIIQMTLRMLTSQAEKATWPASTHTVNLIDCARVLHQNGICSKSRDQGSSTMMPFFSSLSIFWTLKITRQPALLTVRGWKSHPFRAKYQPPPPNPSPYKPQHGVTPGSSLVKIYISFHTKREKSSSPKTCNNGRCHRLFTSKCLQ